MQNIITRRKSHQVKIGGLIMGSDYPVIVQSMTNTPTPDVEATVGQIRQLEEAETLLAEARDSDVAGPCGGGDASSTGAGSSDSAADPGGAACSANVTLLKGQSIGGDAYRQLPASTTTECCAACGAENPWIWGSS